MTDDLQGHSKQDIDASSDAFFFCILGILCCIDIGIFYLIIVGWK